jgi:hypothetical protein
MADLLPVITTRKESFRLEFDQVFTVRSNHKNIPIALFRTPDCIISSNHFDLNCTSHPQGARALVPVLALSKDPNVGVRDLPHAFLV